MPSSTRAALLWSMLEPSSLMGTYSSSPKRLLISSPSLRTASAASSPVASISSLVPFEPHSSSTPITLLALAACPARLTKISHGYFEASCTNLVAARACRPSLLRTSNVPRELLGLSLMAQTGLLLSFRGFERRRTNDPDRLLGPSSERGRHRGARRRSKLRRVY